jgi:hypothetical protein
MDRALAIVTGTFLAMGLLGFVSLFAAVRTHKKIERLRREQHKIA